MSVDKIVKSLIKYSELVDKNISKYKDTGVPVEIYLHYSSLMTTIVEMLTEKKITQSMKDKAINSIKFLGINDTDKIFYKKGGEDENIDVEYFLVGKIKKCFGDECSSYGIIGTNIDGHDFRDRVENWFYKTEAFRDLKLTMIKFIIRFTKEDKNKLLNTCIKIVKSKFIDIIQNNLEIVGKLQSKNIKIPTKPEPKFVIDDKMNSMKLDELVQNKQVLLYMSELEKYAGRMIEVIASLSD